jgi:hypothetical protein
MYDLFAGLLDFDQTNQLKPGLAQKWDISADGKTYKFYLRNDSVRQKIVQAGYERVMSGKHKLTDSVEQLISQL